MTASQSSVAPVAPTAREESTPPQAAGARAARDGMDWAAAGGAAFLALGFGTAIGLALTAAAVTDGRGVGEVRVGAWRYSPGEGSPNPNPYQVAGLVHAATLPMSTGQGVVLTATVDRSGRRLDRGCTYTVGGQLPRARFWTLGVTDADGYPLANPAGREAFTSAEVVRDETGAVSVVVSPVVQPGNWLPLTGKGSFVLTLRLYDSAVGPDTRAPAALPVPAIVPDACP